MEEFGKYHCLGNCDPDDYIATRGASAYWSEASQVWAMSDDMELTIECSECEGEMEFREYEVE
jgi:hypothetical protein